MNVNCSAGGNRSAAPVSFFTNDRTEQDVHYVTSVPNLTEQIRFQLKTKNHGSFDTFIIHVIIVSPRSGGSDAPQRHVAVCICVATAITTMAAGIEELTGSSWALGVVRPGRSITERECNINTLQQSCTGHSSQPRRRYRGGERSATARSGAERLIQFKPTSRCNRRRYANRKGHN